PPSRLSPRTDRSVTRLKARCDFLRTTTVTRAVGPAPRTTCRAGAAGHRALGAAVGGDRSAGAWVRRHRLRRTGDRHFAGDDPAWVARTRGGAGRAGGAQPPALRGSEIGHGSRRDSD